MRSFGLTVGGVFALVFGTLIPLIRGRGLSTWAWIVGGLLIVPALIYPKSLVPVHKVWMGAAEILGRINSRIILGIIYFLLFTPLGLFIRLVGWDPLGRRFDKKATSYRKIASDTSELSRIESPY